MIGKLSGQIDSVGQDSLILDVAGVGYLIFASSRTLDRLPPVGAPSSLLIDTHVREDHIHLYGFSEGEEQSWFRHLSSVQGVGARMALAILSVLPPADLAQAIAAQDRAALTRANGVGPKIAGRIVSELKDKAVHVALAAGSGEGLRRAQAAAAGGSAGAAPSSVSSSGSAEDAVSALVNLGYGRSEAFAAVSKVLRAGDAEPPLESLIRDSLREMAS